MHVTCLNCRTTYELDDALVSAQGTSVQCTSCQHTFTVSRAQDQAELLPGRDLPPRRPVHPAVSAVLGGSPEPLESAHFEGPPPVLSDRSLERAGWFLWVRSQPDRGEELEASWRREWAALSAADDALVRCATRAGRTFRRYRHAAEMARFFDHELCRLELEEMMAEHGLRTSSPVQRILLRGACLRATVDTWWVELEGPAVDGRTHAVIALGDGRDGVTEDTPEGCFALLPDRLAASAPERLRARHARLR